MTQTLHYPPYQCEPDEIRVHVKCGGTVVLKECWKGKSRPYCEGCGKFLNIQQAFMESKVVKLEEVIVENV